MLTAIISSSPASTSDDDVAESDETNNWGQPGDRGKLWGHDDVSISSAAADADLTGYWVQVQDDSYLYGDALTLSHFQVENLGSVATGDFKVEFVLSDDDVGDETDSPLTITGTGSTVLSLSGIAPGSLSPDQTVMLDLPSSGADGDYFIIARIDSDNDVAESNETNNSGQPGDRGKLWGHDEVSISSGASNTDLTGYWVQAESDTGIFGQTLTLSHFQVDNLGVDPSGDFGVKFYLSTDSSGVVGDTELTITGTGSSVLNVSSLPAGGRSLDQTVTLDLPSSGIDGDYFIIARIDWNDQVSETNEANNWGQPGDRGLLWGHDEVEVVSPVDLTGYWVQAQSKHRNFRRDVNAQPFPGRQPRHRRIGRLRCEILSFDR